MAKALLPPPKHFPGKLMRLPKNAKVQKRPLLHAAIPSPFAGEDHQKIIYISSNTPFMSAFKRMQKLFKLIEKRATQSEVARQQSRRRKGRSSHNTAIREDRSESVIIKATGKAVEKALSLALFIHEQPDYDVKITTSSVAAIDDIELSASRALEETEKTQQESHSQKKDESIVREPHLDVVDQDTEIPESHVRLTSLIEIHVIMR